jgi:hypothetical protein
MMPETTCSEAKKLITISAGRKSPAALEKKYSGFLVLLLGGQGHRPSGMNSAVPLEDWDRRFVVRGTEGLADDLLDIHRYAKLTHYFKSVRSPEKTA